MGVVIFMKLAVSVFVAAKICGASNLVDWGDWHEKTKNPNSATNSSSGTVFDTTVSARPQHRGRLHNLVAECAQRLDLRKVTCNKNERGGHNRVPFMESGDLDCGFQVHESKIEISQSSDSRQAVTKCAIAHKNVQDRLNVYFVRNLKTIEQQIL